MAADVTTSAINVEVTGDGYSAYVTVSEPELLLADVQAALEAKGITHGLESTAPFEALKNIRQKVLAASGSPHIDGADGRLEIITLRQSTPAEIKFGITNVYCGETFATVHKPGTGTPGRDVYNREVKPHPGKPATIFVGANVKKTDLGESIKLEAAVDGNLKIHGESIEIDPEHVIRGDIEYSDGEMEFAGSLRILGDVKGSCRLKVNHNIFVQGSVEDATIIAGGNITVKGSFVGRGDGLIRAGGDVEVHVVLNQMVEAEGSITVTKESVNAHLIARNSIVGTRATIMGGVLTAANEVEVCTLGGELYSTTKVKLGTQEFLNEALVAVSKEIELQEKTTAEVKSEIYTLVRDKMDGNTFTQEKAERLNQFQNKLREQNDLIKQLKAKKEVSSAELSKKRCPKLKVRDTIHQSVVAEINGIRLSLKQSYSNVVFEESNNEIIRTRNL